MESGVVLTLDQLQARSGERVIAVGRYRAVQRPRQGPPDPHAPCDRAVLVLDDGTEVFLEPLDESASLRPQPERRRLDGRRVRVCGTAFKLMPSRGEGLIAPCIAGIEEIEPQE